MEPSPTHHQMPMQQQHLGTPTSDDTAQRQSAGQPSVYFHFGQHEAGGDVAMHGMSPLYHPSHHLNSVPPPTVRQYTPRGVGSRPPTPPRQGHEEYSPLYQRNAQYYQYGVLPAPTPRRPPNDHLQSGYTSSAYLPPPTAPQNWIDTTGLPTRLPSFAQLLLGQTPPLHVAPQPAAAPALEPPVQDWPTHNLVSHHTKPLRISKKIDPNLSPEQQMQRKQEIFQQKAARRRQIVQERHQRNQAIAAQRAAYLEAYHTPALGPSTKRTKKRKANNMIQDLVEPSYAPHQPESGPLFYSPGAGYPPVLYPDGREQQIAQDTPAAFSNPDIHYYTDFPDSSQLSQSPSRPPPLDPPSRHLSPNPSYDSQPQEITHVYEDYKWSITLYTLDPSQNFPYAQSFLDALITTTLPSQPHPYKWASHTTRGFIAHGTRFSLLVLHNAANPFTWGSPPDSTTTVGVYGRYWYTHEEIHWMTFAPGIADVLDTAEQQGIIAVARTWACDMPAREKRFHRAYWRAARMMALRGLLGRGLAEDADADAPDAPFADGFEVLERDLRSGWDEGVTRVGAEDARVLWERMVEEVEVQGVPEGGWEHVFTGGSEMEEFG